MKRHQPTGWVTPVRRSAAFSAIITTGAHPRLREPLTRKGFLPS